MTSTARALCENPSNVITVKDKPDEPATLKHIGGSPSDEWNNVPIGQVADCLWLKNSSPELRNRQAGAAIAALISFKPADELESMLAAQLIACHNAGMECFRRAMHGEQTFAGRSENLSQANKLSRSFTVLLEALNRHRGKGQQKVTVEHVHVNNGGQAIVGTVTNAGGGSPAKSEE
ncbi:MAG TPA: hypothetical protein VIE66_08000 [Methylocella sp.]|jgi:hypothetical protein